MSSKQQREQNANNYKDLMCKVGKKRQCNNCRVWHSGEGHFVPPSFGEEGFFICKKVTL